MGAAPVCPGRAPAGETQSVSHGRWGRAAGASGWARVSLKHRVGHALPMEGEGRASAEQPRARF